MSNPWARKARVGSRMPMNVATHIIVGSNSFDQPHRYTHAASSCVGSNSFDQPHRYTHATGSYVGSNSFDHPHRYTHATGSYVGSNSFDHPLKYMQWLFFGLLLCLAGTVRADPSVFMQVEVSPVEGKRYVQQQVLYTSRLFYRMPLTGGRFSPPVAEDAVVETLGDKRQYRVTLGGHRYQVAEQRYAIFPERSGRLNIAPIEFSGTTALTGGALHSREQVAIQQILQRGGIINSRVIRGGAGVAIEIKSEALQLDIEPRPGHYTGVDWLPGQTLTLQDSWTESPPLLQVGEPVVRTLTLEAKGLEASQLPVIELLESDVLRIYPERVQLSNRSDGDWIYGRSELNFTYVATHGGKLSLPAVQVDWWDSINHKQMRTRLPALEIEVQGAGAESAMPMPGTEGADSQGRMFRVIIAALVLLGLWAAVVWVHKRRTAAVGNSEQIDPLAASHAALQAACEQADPQAAARALLDWAAATWPDKPPRSLGVLASRVEQGRQAIQVLESTLYSADSRSWQSGALWAAFTVGLQAAPVADRRESVDSSVPALYPDW
ncbi:hypothetical protein MNBD_GAMMA13-1167 [hydrothermal vent metagenome]|uniref:DUF7939 domain-containing protein n=1 Tax=hydrothermal vent metagenome TaxID=652676 RepID=A0A3B0YYJ2_9ZZZZ